MRYDREIHIVLKKSLKVIPSIQNYKYLFLRQLRTHQAFKRATRKATLKYAAKGIIILAYIILYHMPAYLW